MNTNPHDREYAGAAAGMADQYGHCTYAVGDRVTYRLAGDGNGYRVGRVTESTGSGSVLEIREEGGDGHHVIDARPWPTGNVLPF